MLKPDRTLKVDGLNPVPQPRPRAFVRGKGDNAKAAVTGATRKHPVHKWRASVTAAAIERSWTPYDGPVEIELLFRFARPPSHLRVNGEPRAAAPAYPPRVDLDNLAKSTMDALDGLAWRDDAQVVRLYTRKTYDATPGVTIHLSRSRTEASE